MFRFLEPRETNTSNIVLFRGKKPLERLRETVSKHLDRGGWDVFALPFEDGLKRLYLLGNVPCSS